MAKWNCEDFSPALDAGRGTSAIELKKITVTLRCGIET
jgi:hypothetical protein